MQLLFKRTQSKNFLGRTAFQLWAKADCDAAEKEVARKYQLQNAVMIYIEQPGLLRMSIFVGFLAFVCTLGYVVGFYWRVFGSNWFSVAGFAAVLGTFVSFLTYHKLRETVLVEDLMHGRTFTCGSVVELAQKEEWLRRLTGSFKNTMEASKAWGGEQVIEIPDVDGEDAIKLLQGRV